MKKKKTKKPTLDAQVGAVAGDAGGVADDALVETRVAAAQVGQRQDAGERVQFLHLDAGRSTLHCCFDDEGDTPLK